MTRSIFFTALLLCSMFFFINAHASDKRLKSSSTSASTNINSRNINSANRSSTNSSSTNSNATKLNLNNISTWIYNNGNSDLAPNGIPGVDFPRGSGNTIIYESGLVWGAKVNGEIRVGGSTYNQGLQRGKILPNGAADDTSLVKTRIYRVRPDYKTADFSIEASEENRSQQEIFLQYEKDWYEWPAEDGAPYQDVNGDGKYDPAVDIPGIKNAVQTVWFVANDLNADLTSKLYGSRPMGIEMQATFWTYDRDFVLRNTYFRKYRLINKSNTAFNDMYVNMWCDPDVGDATNDLAGCDTTLNLGFAYNGYPLDPVYNQFPPAVGFDLLQGPIVKGTAGKDINRNGIDDIQDTAVFNGNKSMKGYINLPMTAFYYFCLGVPALADPTLGSYEGTIQMYNFMQGKVGKTGNYFLTPEGKQTSYLITGDPVTGTGWLDGVQTPDGDRRIGISAGPFNMAPGDTQEVIIAELAAMGTNRMNSVYLLKEYDKKIKQYYDGSFNFNTVTPAPASPTVTGSYTKNGIYLNWQADSLIEKFSKDGFNFEGYNVYQLPNGIPDKKNGVKLASFDLINGIKEIYGGETDSLTLNTVIKLQQQGKDNGIQRSFTTLRDTLDKIPFLIGKKYYFGVSAYTFKHDSEGILTNSESPMKVISIVFQDSLSGLKYMDTLKVIRISGQSDKMVTAVVYDPSKLTGHDYEIGFENAPGTITCYVKDLTLNTYLTHDINQVERVNPALGDPVIDGVLIGVHDAVAGMKDYLIPAGTRKWSWVNANFFHMEGFNGAIGAAYKNWSPTPSVSFRNLTNALIRFASTDSLGNLLDPNDPNASYAYRYLCNAQNPPARPEFQQYIKNTSESYAFQDYAKSLPFAVYNEIGQRLMVGFLENNVAGGRVDGKYWPPASDEGISNTSFAGPREWFFIFNVPYSTTPSPELQTNIINNTVPILWFGTPNRTGASNTAFDKNDQFLIIKSNKFTTEDKFSFKTGNITSVKQENIPLKFELGQNYPNPFNPKTQILFSLAERGMVTLRVYNVLGQMVKELVNGELNAGIHKLEFSGNNLSSGIYIYRLYVKDKFTDVKKMLLLK